MFTQTELQTVAGANIKMPSIGCVGNNTYICLNIHSGVCLKSVFLFHGFRASLSRTVILRFLAQCSQSLSDGTRTDSPKSLAIMIFSELCNELFDKSTADYHITDSVDAAMNNPYEFKSIEYYLYLKNWIDAVQWHFEDIIRDPQIDPVEALTLKRRIDKSNQDRTDLVELIDSYFLDKYKDVTPLKEAVINTESPAWAVDRLSILALKIYHMKQEAERTDTTEEHRSQCQKKLDVLLEQRRDLSTAIDQLLADIESGKKYMKVYKQMKMYNDPALNPVLYAKK